MLPTIVRNLPAPLQATVVTAAGGTAAGASADDSLPLAARIAKLLGTDAVRDADNAPPPPAAAAGDAAEALAALLAKGPVNPLLADALSQMEGAVLRPLLRGLLKSGGLADEIEKLGAAMGRGGVGHLKKGGTLKKHVGRVSSLPNMRHHSQETLPLEKCLQLVGAIVVARVREDAVSDAKGRPRTALKKFVRDKMLRDYGLRSTAEKMGRDLRSSVERFSQEWKHGGATMAPVGRIRYFYEALYNFSDGGDDAWSERQVAFYFAAVGALAPDEKTLCAVDAAIPYSDAGHAVEAVCIAPATRKALLEKVKALPPISHPETDDPEKKAVEAKGGGLAGGAVKRSSAIVVKEPEVSLEAVLALLIDAWVAEEEAGREKNDERFAELFAQFDGDGTPRHSPATSRHPARPRV